MLEALEGDLRDVVTLGIIDGDEHVRNAKADARNDTGGEELADVKSGGGGVDYHNDARRDDRADTGRGDDYRRSPALLVTALLERSQADRAESGSVSVGGAGDTGHEHTGKLDRTGEAAAHPADDGVCEVDYRFRYARALHDLTGKHEERNRHEREAVDRGVHFLTHDHVRNAAVLKQPYDGRNAEAEDDGRADYEQRHKYCDAYPKNHFSVSFPLLRAFSPPASSNI